MAGYDQKSNIVLSDSKERVYSIDDGVEEIPLGLYLVKGDQMYVCFFVCAMLLLGVGFLFVLGWLMRLLFVFCAFTLWTLFPDCVPRAASS